jgi:ribonuclease P protein component
MAGKRVGSAVARNRAKRRLREAVRARWPQMAPGWDLVWIARKPVVTAAWPEVQQAVEQLLRRARVLKANG